MDLETKIKELEKKLELKKAYLDVSVSFGRGNKISAEVREEITTKIKEFCAKLADSTAEEAPETTNSIFTEQETQILKELAAKLANGSTKTAPAKPQHSVTGEPESKMSSMVSQALQTIKSQNRAQLLMLDNIDRSVRDKVQPNSIVRVVGRMDESTVLVETERGVRFHVPVDDLEFNLE